IISRRLRDPLQRFQAEATVKFVRFADTLSVGTIQKQDHVDPPLFDDQAEVLPFAQSDSIRMCLSVGQLPLDRRVGREHIRSMGGGYGEDAAEAYSQNHEEARARCLARG